ncbi:MAG: SEC-C metal-binding domain-containing protein [Bacillota bacterium]|nr:SEC-C metal-binding domain-containing protein [Bacillota bacterium]MDW7682665.1 SEC-C metal-binding domain-containing protein [Bacillota bacterium]
MLSKLPKELQKRLDEKMQAGYRLMYADNDPGAADEWLEVWEMIKSAMDEYGINSIEDFDREFEGKEPVYNWSGDFEMTLENAGRGNSLYLEKRIVFCREYIERYHDRTDYNIMNMKRAVAESYFRLGQKADGELLFQKITEEYPFWSWGWIGWADMYWLFGREEDKNSDKAIALLQRALQEKELDERHEVQQRLKDLYLDLGMKKEADAIKVKRQKQKPIQQARVKQTPVQVTKVGRNEPCPCGSGKKYKKCCAG